MGKKMESILIEHLLYAKHDAPYCYFINHMKIQ